MTGVRWYATDLALLESLMFRAAGPRSDEQICFDQPISGLYDELQTRNPRLRALRNALFSHPPFVDELIDDASVLFFSTVTSIQS